MTAVDGFIEHDVLRRAITEIYSKRSKDELNEANITAAQSCELAEIHLGEVNGCLTPMDRMRAEAVHAAAILHDAMMHGWDYERIVSIANNETATFVSQITPDNRLPYPLRERLFISQLLQADDLSKLIYLVRIRRRLPVLQNYSYEMVKNFTTQRIEHVRDLTLDKRSKTGLAVMQVVRTKLYAIETAVRNRGAWKQHLLTNGVLTAIPAQKHKKPTRRKSTKRSK